MIRKLKIVAFFLSVCSAAHIQEEGTDAAGADCCLSLLLSPLQHMLLIT